MRGITVGEDGATHQSLEDISCMRTLPNMTVEFLQTSAKQRLLLIGLHLMKALYMCVLVVQVLMM